MPKVAEWMVSEFELSSRSQLRIMLIIPVKEGENIERALKRFKKKFDRTKTGRLLRARKEYVKPKTVRREAMKKAVYKNKKALMG